MGSTASSESPRKKSQANYDSEEEAVDDGTVRSPDFFDRYSQRESSRSTAPTRPSERSSASGGEGYESPSCVSKSMGVKKSGILKSAHTSAPQLDRASPLTSLAANDSSLPRNPGAIRWSWANQMVPIGEFSITGSYIIN